MKALLVVLVLWTPILAENGVSFVNESEMKGV